MAVERPADTSLLAVSVTHTTLLASTDAGEPASKIAATERSDVGGTLIGALTMGVLRNGLNLLGISSFLQQIVIGFVIIVAVLTDSLVKSKRR